MISRDDETREMFQTLHSLWTQSSFFAVFETRGTV